MSSNRKTQNLKSRSQTVAGSLSSSRKRNDLPSSTANIISTRNINNVHREEIPVSKINSEIQPQNGRSHLDDILSVREEPHGNPVKLNSTKHKGNLTTSSFPSLQISMELPDMSYHPKGNKESFHEGTTISLSNQCRKSEKENKDASVDTTITNEISKMYDLTNGFQREILSLEEDNVKGNTKLKLLKRQVVFVKWINELSESNMYLLNLMNIQNKGYEEQINQYKQAIKIIVSDMENCKQDSTNIRFEAEGLADQNKFMQKLIQTLQDNLKHRENEIRTLEILKETCDKSKTSFMDVLIKLRDTKSNFSGEEFAPFFKTKSKFITFTDNEEILQKELQYLRNEKHEMQSILQIKNGEIRKLKEAVRNHDEMLKTQMHPRNQEAQTIVSFDRDVKLEGHEDLFVFQ